MTVPLVSEAVQDFVARDFMKNRGYLVDFVGHSAFCLEAHKGGLLHESDLNQLNLYPNGYGLHIVTSRAANRSAGRIDINLAQAVPDAADRVVTLAKPLVDIPFAANLTLACIELGLLHESAVAPLVAQGTDCGFELLSTCNETLGSLLAKEQRLARVIENGVGYTDVVLHTSIVGQTFQIQSTGMNFFHLNLPETIEGDFVEVNVLLFKTLDALSHYCVPFHTPASWMGKDGVYTHTLGEVYAELKERIQNYSREELFDYLMDLDCDEAKFETYALGMEGQGPHDEDIVERACDLLLESAELATHFSFRLDYSEGSNEAHRKVEMQAMRSQVQELIDNGSAHSRLLVALADALETCIDLSDRHFFIGGQQFEGSESEGIGLFETILVVVDDRMSSLFDEAEEGFNSYAENCAEIYTALPLESREVVAQTTVPIIKRTQQCLAHLRQIQLSLEGTPNA
ncbi:hypothetical protein [Pseudomonas sp. NPDC089569]|uniref:hypothetical protein n=1 Tax=Pseudomonas sp. NPDC089569 TaxID=3390722 RepID=UPI003D07656C